MRKTAFILTLLILTIGGQTAFAHTGKNTCSMQAYVIDTNPEGIVIHSEPSDGSKTLATLKIEYGDTALPAITVKVIGYSNGWVKIGSANEMTGEIKFPKSISSKEIFFGTGWIPASVVAVRTKVGAKATKSVQLYADAKATSKKSGNIPNDYPVKITGFACDYLKVEYEGQAGWVKKANICGNPVADCR